MALPGIGTIALIGGGSLAVVGSVIALWTHYVETLDTISDTGGEVVPEPIAIPAIPEGYQPKVDEIVEGYEGAYFDPIEKAGDQVADPSAPDPVVRVPSTATTTADAAPTQ